jgi:hypothetical protein
MGDKNTFGGGNARSLYVPMSEVEQEVIARLVESGDLHVHIVGWGVVHSPVVTFGDLRLSIPIQITFNRPEIPILVDEFTLELRTGAGLLLFREKQSAEYGGQPLAIGRGTVLTMVWDIAIQSIDPKLVKLIKPGATGLTSRLQDKDTGQMTLVGNMKLNRKQRRELEMVRRGEAKAREHTKAKVAKAKKPSP